MTPELAWQCALLFGVGIESIMRDDRKLLNIRGEPWVKEDGPLSLDERVDLAISTGGDPSEALGPLLKKLRRSEKTDLMERCALVRETLLEIARVARHFAKEEKKLADSLSAGDRDTRDES